MVLMLDSIWASFIPYEGSMNKKAFITLFVVVFTGMLGMGIISPLMPLYAESMGTSGLQLGLMYSGFALSRVVVMPITGRLSDRRGRKIFIAIGLLAYTIISLLRSGG